MELLLVGAVGARVTLQPCANASRLALGASGTIPVLPLSAKCVEVVAPTARAELSAGDCRQVYIIIHYSCQHTPLMNISYLMFATHAVTRRTSSL